jgi:hypothetical protein
MRLKNNICRVLHYLEHLYLLWLVPQRISDLSQANHHPESRLGLRGFGMKTYRF